VSDGRRLGLGALAGALLFGGIFGGMACSDAKKHYLAARNKYGPAVSTIASLARFLEPADTTHASVARAEFAQARILEATKAWPAPPKSSTEKEIAEAGENPFVGIGAHQGQARTRGDRCARRRRGRDALPRGDGARHRPARPRWVVEEARERALLVPARRVPRDDDLVRQVEVERPARTFTRRVGYRLPPQCPRETDRSSCSSARSRSRSAAPRNRRPSPPRALR
jgi:hypothetical protein